MSGSAEGEELIPQNGSSSVVWKYFDWIDKGCYP